MASQQPAAEASPAAQCFHVQLHGGAPWGFTLKGGLEHGEPLIVSKIEDGGKAAKSEKMEVGDELVNINGTPLYGSRQEALILIKGSYKILKMIVRRRNVSLVRPHSWHLAKLYEVHPDVASMQYPTDAFSLSWHSGCETSELPMQWNPLSRHCSTDKSSSIGSMESLDQPGQNYYEGTLSPIDPSMYQNKRDSAYSSFSASSNTSDYTLSARTEESSPFNCNLGSTKQEDGRYLQTGQNAFESQDSLSVVKSSERPSSFSYEPCESPNPMDSIKSPPQPPVRRDSLRTPKNQVCQTERRRASAPGETFYIPGKWSKDTNRYSANCGQRTSEFNMSHHKDIGSSDQYYMLSSQTDGVIPENIQPPVCDKSQTNICSQQNNVWSADKREAENQNDEDVACYTVQKIRESFLKKSSCEYPKPKHNSYQGESARINSVYKNAKLAASETRIYDKENCIGEKRKSTKSQNGTLEGIQVISDANDCEATAHHGVSFDRSVMELNEPKETNSFTEGLRLHCSTKALQESGSLLEENAGAGKKPGSSRNRSAQMRRKSDRFATNLRNEIQKRKSQLQKSKGSSVLLCGEDPVEERDEPNDCQPRPAPPPPPKNKARLLELKKAHAEKFCISDCSNQEKVDNSDFDKEKVVTCKREDIVPHHLSHSFLKKTDPEEIPHIALRNKALDDWFERSSSEVPNHESLDGEEENLSNQKVTEHLFGHSNMDLPLSANTSPKSVRDEPLNVTSSKCDSPNITVKEKESSIDHLRSRADHLDLSVKDTNSKKLYRASSIQNICPTETFARPETEERRFMKNRKSVGNPTNPSKTHQSVERLVGDQLNINSLANIVQDKQVVEQHLGKMDNLSSACSVQSKACHPPPCPEEVFSPPKPHGAKCKWSPDNHYHLHSPLLNEGPPDISGPNMDGVVPPITRVIEENVLMPFADRRRFFEDSSKVPTATHISMHLKANKNNFCPNLSNYPMPHSMPPEVRRHSVDHTYYPSSPSIQEAGMSCSECCTNHALEPPLCCVQSGHPSDCLHSVPYGYRSCAYCSDMCPALLKRTHHSCHCQHHHHYHHQWTRCGEFVCPNQHSLLEEGSPIHGDPWHSRKPILQEVPLNEWNQKKINRKCSQSVSELCHFNPSFHHLGPHRSHCDGSDQEWQPCYKASSTYDLSCAHPVRPADFAAVQEGPSEPGLSRGRAYSVNQLNLECLSFRDKQDLPLKKLEEPEPLTRPKKQAPPRPPPPNWEKYKGRKSSHDTGTSFSGYGHCNDALSIHGYNTSVEDTRQRSHSLPISNTFLQVRQNSPLLLQGTDYNTACSESRRSSQGSQDFTVSSSQEHLNETSPARRSVGSRDSEASPSGNAVESETAEEGEPEKHSFCSKISKTELSPENPEGDYPPTFADVFESRYQRFEDEWSTDRESEMSIPERYEFQPISPPPVCEAVSPTCTSYYNTSAAKAGLLNKMKEMPGMQKEADNISGVDEEEDELAYKKMQLIESITRKISVLREAQQGLQEDVNANVTLGCELESLLKSICKPHEYDKFRSLIGDVDKVVNLLLSLSGRLSRVESALNCEDPVPTMEEKLNLLEKKKQLTDQLEDAQELKAHVTRREQLVLEAISKYLNEEQLQDYQHYVRMISALIVEQRELEDKIRLGEEQLRCLRESL